jgi:predicted dehydrogenase
MQSGKKKTKVGLLGAGGVVKDMHLPVLVNMPDVSISWICDKDRQRAAHLSGLFGIPGVHQSLDECADVDIVLVAIPVGYRRDVMKRIYSRGWHAFCEKPFAVTRAEHEQYLTDARAQNVQVGVGLLRRYGPATLMARKIIASGCFGPITAVWASEGFRTKRTGKDSGWYMGDPKVVGGGVLMETGSHLVDQLCTILDVISFNVNSCTQRTLANLEFETRFSGSVSTDRQREIPAAFEVSRLEDLCNGIFIQFSSFIMKCGLFFADPLEIITTDGRTLARLAAEEGAGTLGQALFLEWKDFIEQCMTGKPSYISAETAIQSTALIERCYEIGDKSRANAIETECVENA